MINMRKGMTSLEDTIARNVMDEINKGIKEPSRDGFFACVIDGKLKIKSNIHPWVKNSKVKRKIALEKLQKKIGGEIVKWFGDLELQFDVSNIKSARCNRNQKSFSFNGWVQFICEEDKDGNIIVPVEVLELFRREFPNTHFISEESKWVFVEYDGEYPGLCAGDTILKSGSTIIKTKIIRHGTFWELNIPEILQDVVLPNELFKYDHVPTDCCGGCD